jgi:hypothetical protein
MTVTRTPVRNGDWQAVIIVGCWFTIKQARSFIEVAFVVSKLYPTARRLAALNKYIIATIHNNR